MKATHVGFMLFLDFVGLASGLDSSLIRAADRLTLNFNPDWRFTKNDLNLVAGIDERQWTTVSAPHTYNDTDTFDDWSIPGHRGEQDQWSGRTWYRKSFDVPASWKGRKVYVEFEAVRQVAEVYLNGRLLGVCKTGFTPFGLDLTPYLRFGEANVLAVMCDNRFMRDPMPGQTGRDTSLAQMSAKANEAVPEDVNLIQADQIPWNNPHWHPAHGGLYRNVRLYVTDPLHISLPLYSFLRTAGPYVYATDVSDAAAKVCIEVPVENGRVSATSVEVTATVLDRDGKPVLTLTQDGQVAAGESSVFRLSGLLARPQPWEPDYPYLYRVVCSLRVSGETIDSCEVPFGIRTVRWDVKTGLYINGRHLKLHGWGQKPTDEWPGLGAAQPDWMHFFTLQLMKEAGGNFVRWGHCLGGPAQVEAADRLGLITEQPGVDGESDTRGAAWTIRASAFRDTVIYFRNHPSILIWEGGNQKVSSSHARELRGYMDQYDPHGGRAYAHRRADQITAEFMDIGIGTEGGREIAQLPVVEGEYNREESPRRVWDDASPPGFGYPEAKGQTYQLTSEPFATNQVDQFVRKLGAENHCGGANWIFSDSTSGGRVACEVARASGEVDGARLAKEAYYVCQAMFHPYPQVHIIGHWTYPPSTKKTVYVASNGEEVELFVNGRSLGKGKVSDRYLFTFPDVTWEPGEIKAVAYSGGKAHAEQVKHTVGPAVALRMTAITGPGGLRADGSDVALIDVEAIDAKGDRCPTFQQRVDFEVEGPALWRGGYNSGKIKSINNTYLDLECGINRVAVRATREAGTITVKARGDGLKAGRVEIRSVPVKVEGGCAAELPLIPAVAFPKESLARSSRVPAQGASSKARQGRIGRFITAFSYSGPTPLVHVEQNAAEGRNVYVDRDWPFAELPKDLAGADWVQAAEADGLYNAVDLMEMGVKAGSVVFVAHDNRLARPAWLTRQFQTTDLSLVVNGQAMTVFQRLIEKDGGLTLGANTEDAGVKTARMYVVFVNAVSGDGPRVFLLDARYLLAARQRVRNGDKALDPALAKLRQEAQRSLKAGPFSVMNKDATPPSGDKHDYMSQAPYWWPHPDTPNGLPYIRRDGERNPDIYKITDHRDMGRMTEAVETLALAYWFTGDDAFVEKAAQLLRAWFVDPATRMNPHLEYGQAVPGLNTGRGIGLIETSGLTNLVDAIGLLEGSKSWTAGDQRDLEAWFGRFLLWMQESKHGRDEASARNNHGTYYDLQVASFALFVGRTDVAAKVLKAAGPGRIGRQIEPDGRQPLELERTRAWSYSLMNLRGLMSLARIAENVAVDLWTYQTQDGRSIRKALDYLLPFALGDRKWPHRQLGGWSPEGIYPRKRSREIEVLQKDPWIVR